MFRTPPPPPPCRYRGIVQDKWYRHFCAALASSYQMMGAILYLGAEMHDGFEHLPTYVSLTDVKMGRQAHITQAHRALWEAWLLIS